MTQLITENVSIEKDEPKKCYICGHDYLHRVIKGRKRKETFFERFNTMYWFCSVTHKKEFKSNKKPKPKPKPKLFTIEVKKGPVTHVFESKRK